MTRLFWTIGPRVKQPIVHSESQEGTGECIFKVTADGAVLYRSCRGKHIAVGDMVRGKSVRVNSHTRARHDWGEQESLKR
jgi:hypothetical protein